MLKRVILVKDKKNVIRVKTEKSYTSTCDKIVV